MDSFKGLYKAVRKEMLIIFASLICGLIISAIITKVYSDTTSESLANKFIRLHVLANSNIEDDQVLKLKVRDSVMNMLAQKMVICTNIDEARETVILLLDEIKHTADTTVKKEGYDYETKVTVDKSNFPTKTYGSFSLVAGTYEALKIEIGAAKGNNWWCVVYPPLCFVDVATGNKTVSSDKVEKQLRDDLSEGEYKLVTDSDSLPIIIKFKAIELWQAQKLAKETKREAGRQLVTVK